MNNIQLFNFNGAEVRVMAEANKEPWFVAKDISAILGYSDAEAMTRRLDDDEIQNRQIVGFGNRGVNIINESGLYNAILGSSKPEARKFRKWVTSEVLPAIRRDGGYIATNGEEDEAEIMARALQIANATIERSKARLAEANRQLIEQAPAVEYCNDVLSAENLHTVNTVAVTLGVSARRLNQFLVDEGWIYKQGDVYCPSCKIRDLEYCRYHIVPYINSNGEKMTREHLKWTEEGRKAIIELWNTRNGKVA